MRSKLSVIESHPSLFFRRYGLQPEKEFLSHELPAHIYFWNEGSTLMKESEKIKENSENEVRMPLPSSTAKKSAGRRKVIAVIGVGLMGGSLAIRLHERKLSSRLIGVDLNEDHAKKALELELVDEMLPLDEAIEQSEVIALAIPMDQMVALLPSILDKITRQVVFDLGSTKRLLTEVIKNHPKRGRFVATHPMWGTEYSGPGAAVKGAFDRKAVVICNGTDSDTDALDWVRTMYKKIGMHVLEMEAKAHDVHAAYVSHISHITSFALANTVLEKEKADEAIFEMASSGFESTVRLAKSHPEMWVPIFLQNKEPLLDVLKEHIAQLNRFKESIELEDHEYLERLIAEANRIKRILK